VIFQLAKLIGDIATGQRRAGGLKGGVVRAASVSKKKRVEIAKKAAKTRWKVAAEDNSE
jgi:hypothetical protein